MRFVIALAAGLIVTVLLLVLAKEYLAETRTGRLLKQFVVLEALLVALPWFVLGLSYLIPPVVWLVGVFFGTPYYFLPRMIFGNAHFHFLLAATFADYAGMAQAAAFYSAAAVLLSLLRLLPSRGTSGTTLIKCSRCGGEITFDAVSCSHCGFQFAS